MKKRFLLLLLCLMVILVSCNSNEKQPTFSPYPFAYPETGNDKVSLSIYNYDNATERLSSSIVRLDKPSEKTLLNTALDYYFSLPEFQDILIERTNPVKYNIIVANRIAVLNIGATINRELNSGEIEGFITAVSNTINTLENIEYIMVYDKNGEVLKENRYFGPIDIRTLTSRKLHISRNTQSNTQNFLLYFIDDSNSFILPEIHSLKIDTADKKFFIESIIKALKAGPKNPLSFVSAINPEANFQVIIDERSDDIIIDFSSTPNKSTGSLESLCYASIYHTITAVYPEITEIQFKVQGRPVQTIPGAADGLVTPYTFQKSYGSTVVLYFLNTNTNFLFPATRTIEYTKISDPEYILSLLFTGIRTTDNQNISPLLPMDTSTEDILGCTVISDTIYVDMSANFWEQCKTYSPNSESLMIYSIVNSLTQVEGINNVQFLNNGHVFESNGISLNFSRPFLSNPGLIKTL